MAADTFSRVYVELVNTKKVAVNYDFAYGEYVSTKSFFDKLSKVQEDLLEDGKITLETGKTVSSDSPGGLIAIQIYMEALESRRQSMSGLAKLGLNVEKQVWKNI